MEEDQLLNFVLASSNNGKIAEIQDLLMDLPIVLTKQSDIDIDEIEETGTTFVENAIIKARHAAQISGLPAIADDSGLTIDALDGAPGVFSARYAGRNATDEDRINKVLEELVDVPDEERSAAFHCVTVLMEHENDPAPLICHGIWGGVILRAPVGDQGFGYDPIFYVPEYDCSAAELEPGLKNQISHRGIALQQFAEIIRQELSVLQ